MSMQDDDLGAIAERFTSISLGGDLQKKVVAFADHIMTSSLNEHQQRGLAQAIDRFEPIARLFVEYIRQQMPIMNLQQQHRAFRVVKNMERAGTLVEELARHILDLRKQSPEHIAAELATLATSHLTQDERQKIAAPLMHPQVADAFRQLVTNGMHSMKDQEKENTLAVVQAAIEQHLKTYKRQRQTPEYEETPTRRKRKPAEQLSREAGSHAEGHLSTLREALKQSLSAGTPSPIDMDVD